MEHRDQSNVESEPHDAVSRACDAALRESYRKGARDALRAAFWTWVTYWLLTRSRRDEEIAVARWGGYLEACRDITRGMRK